MIAALRARIPSPALAARAAVVAGSYLAAAATILVVILLLRERIAPAALRSALGCYFIAATAGGLEPATAKAAALARGRAPGGGWTRGEADGLLLACAAKAAVAAPALALIWRFADPTLPVATLAWTPAIVLAGFAATDLRVLLDIDGRHARAIWLKQGVLVAGTVALAAALLAGRDVSWAIGFSALFRLALAGAAVATWRARTAPAPAIGATQAAWRHLGNRRWLQLAGASVLGAAGGSIDRVLALRLLPAAAYAGYAFVYEAASRFWLIPYIAAPILFARLAAGQPAHRIVRGAAALTGAAGAAMLAIVCAAVALAPTRVRHLAATDHGWTLVLFTLGIVLSAFAQLRVIALQGSGETGRAAAAVAFGAVASGFVFWQAIARLGVAGLYAAWCAKAAIDLAAAYARAGPWRRAPSLGRSAPAAEPTPP